MSTREQFFLGRWITNPKHLARCAVNFQSLHIKNTMSTVVNSDSSATTFWTNLAYAGAVGTVTADDTFVTICDITGAGFMVNAIAPMDNTAYLPTIKITVDGRVFTLAPSGNINADNRFVIGPLILAYNIAGPDYYIGTSSSYYDPGFSTAAASGTHVRIGAVTIPHPDTALSEGRPMLRFEKSLKVEAKTSLRGAAAEYDKCGVTYVLDI